MRDRSMKIEREIKVREKTQEGRKYADVEAD